MFMLCGPLVTVRVDVMDAHRRALRRAIARVYDSDKSACADMDVKQSHYSNEMAGERPLNLDSKSNLDRRVWPWYAVYLAAEFGMPDELSTALELDTVTRRMARMDASDLTRRRA